jgi:hypothetical protein
MAVAGAFTQAKTSTNNFSENSRKIAKVNSLDSTPTDLEPLNSRSVGVLKPKTLWSRQFKSERSFPPASSAGASCLPR